MRVRFVPQLESLELRALPSALLFQDTFNTDANPNGDGWYDVNHAFDTGRQSGLLAPLPYLEPDATAAGGPADNLTQVNNPGFRDTLLLANDPGAGHNFTYVWPDQNFAADGLSVTHLQVAIDPLGPGSSPSTDHWAALVFGTTPGSFIIGAGTGVLVRDSGEYELWDRGTLVSSGNVGAKTTPKQLYAVDFAITPSTGQFILSIDGQQLFTGSHGGAYTTNYVTLEDYTTTNDTGVMVDYFDHLVVRGTARPGPIIAAANTTYYVSPQGNDSNPGTSPSTAWQTIAHVNGVEFRPGDQVLFQGGATFAGNLTFDSADYGTAAAPITVGSYGSGPATIVAGTGTGIAVADASNFTISNLNFVGSGHASNGGDGLRFTSDLPGMSVTGISVSNVDVSSFGQVGIHFAGANASGDFRGVSVTYCNTHDNGNGGLAVDAQGSAANLYVGHVHAYHNAGSADIESGYGIFIAGASDVVVERCVADNNGWLAGNVGETGGIEAIADNRVLLQYDEAYNNHKGAADGDGIILDTTTNSIMQFNYTHNNDGGGLFLGAENGTTSTNSVVRFNVSQNDARTQGNVYGGIFVWQNVSNADIYGNTVFMGPSPNSSPAAIRFLGLSGTSVHVRNNIFITTGGVPLVFYDGGGTDLLFQGNDYWSSGAAFQIQWVSTTYNSLDGSNGWRANTGQEMLNGAAVGFAVDPQLKRPGMGGSIGNADLLAHLTAYQLRRTSPVRHAGLDLSQLGVVWDPYAYAADAFMSPHFNATPTDFFGDTLPASGSGLFSIGADQLT
jgi:hypothetical protein